MKAAMLVVLLAVCAIECRKAVPINKNANIDFINMESGGVQPVGPVRPTVPAPSPVKPQSPPSPTPSQPKSPVPVTTTKPVIIPVPTVPPTPVKPQVPKPVQPNQTNLKPVPAKTAAGGVSTPGYGNVKGLVNFYDSQGKQYMIRPYSYSDAVKKQGSKPN